MPLPHVKKNIRKGMATWRFSVEAVIHGYHEYKSIWLDPVMEEELSCEREIGNAHDTHAVAICKTVNGEVKTVRHVPRNISSICSIFIRRGGSILCTVKGPRQYSSDLSQGGLEIPCTLEFVSHKENEAVKAERLLESALGSKGKKVLKEIKENDLKASVHMAVPATNLKKAVPASHLKKLSAGDVVDLVVDDEEKSPPTKKPKLYYERIIMGEELTDMEINHAQQLLKAKHPNFNGFQSSKKTGTV